MTVAREKVYFDSGDTRCAAWHYEGSTNACVIMAPGFAVTKEPATDRFAAAFNGAGFGVLAFDYRRFGESDGQPRQLARIKDEHADLQAAIDFAPSLPGVDGNRLAIWGFSLSGGHIFVVASRNPQLAAAIAVSANANGQPAARNAMRHTTTGAFLRLSGRGLLDAAGGVVGRKPLLVPLTGNPGTVAVISTPDALNGNQALNPGNRYPDWRQEVAARSALRIGFYRPGRHAPHIECPLLVLAYEQDGAALSGPAVRAAKRAPRGELHLLPGGHYEPFLSGRERALEIQVDFLRWHLGTGTGQK
jgi:pimeloyl-ACP methyl ester carboxylesterase